MVISGLSSIVCTLESGGEEACLSSVQSELNKVAGMKRNPLVIQFHLNSSRLGLSGPLHHKKALVSSSEVLS